LIVGSAQSGGKQGIAIRGMSGAGRQQRKHGDQLP
jgi:hypothetical protein